MATLLMQPPDLVTSEKALFASFGNVPSQAEAVTGISQSHHKAEQVGRSKSKKVKNGQKKQPKRGLGVAQLEKLRLQEQTRQETASLVSVNPHVLPFSSTSSFENDESVLSLPYSLRDAYMDGNGCRPEIPFLLKYEKEKATHPGNSRSTLVSHSVADNHSSKPGVVAGRQTLNLRSVLSLSHSDQNIVLDNTRSRDTAYGATSLHSISYTSQLKSKQEYDGVKDDVTSGKRVLPSSVVSLELTERTLGSSCVLHPQSSVICSSFGERPKELSSFQNYVGTQVWSSTEKNASKKCKFLDLPDRSNSSHSAELDHNTAVLKPELKFQDYTGSKVYSGSDDMESKLSTERNFSIKITSQTGSAKLIPVLPKNQNLLSDDDSWPERSTYFGDYCTVKDYKVQPTTIYNAPVGNTSFDCEKAYTCIELLPIHHGHRSPTDALTLQLASTPSSTLSELETRENFGGKAVTPVSSENHNVSHIQASDGDWVIQSKTWKSAQVENINFHVFPKVERSGVDALSERHSTRVACWTFLPGDNPTPGNKYSTCQETGCNADAKGGALDLSLKLAL